MDRFSTSLVVYWTKNWQMGPSMWNFCIIFPRCADDGGEGIMALGGYGREDVRDGGGTAGTGRKKAGRGTGTAGRGTAMARGAVYGTVYWTTSDATRPKRLHHRGV